MITEEQFINEVFRVAEGQGYKIELNRRYNLKQIDFGHKKLHAGHLKKLYPGILNSRESIAKQIEKVAPGRPCTHKPMRSILKEILQRGK